MDISVISRVCASHDFCAECELYQKKCGECLICGTSPENWDKELIERGVRNYEKANNLL